MVISLKLAMSTPTNSVDTEANMDRVRRVRDLERRRQAAIASQVRNMDMLLEFEEEVQSLGARIVQHDKEREGAEIDEHDQIQRLQMRIRQMRLELAIIRLWEDVEDDIRMQQIHQ